MIKLSNLLVKNRVTSTDEKLSKTEFLDKLIDSLSNKISDLSVFRSDLLERENLVSTGLGHGVALPHVASDAVDELTVTVLVCSSGVDYDAVDGKPVYIAFMIAQPESGKTREYLHLLATISRLFRGTNLLENILTNPDDAFDIIHSAAVERGF